jgi:hypothetical protein
MAAIKKRAFRQRAFAEREKVTYGCIAILPTKAETAMNSSNSTTQDSAFPAAFIVFSSLIGALVWLCVMLAGMAQS